MRRFLSAGFSIIVLFAFFHVWISEEEVYLSVDTDHGSIVQLTFRREFPYLGITSYLVVRDYNWIQKSRALLLQNRDHFTDIRNEFFGLTVDEQGIHLQAKGERYKGPVNFPLPPAVPF